eukprot:10186455-Lingulodinium_polyedra.AAC.1
MAFALVDNVKGAATLCGDPRGARLNTKTIHERPCPNTRAILAGRAPTRRSSRTMPPSQCEPRRQYQHGG